MLLFSGISLPSSSASQPSTTFLQSTPKTSYSSSSRPVLSCWTHGTDELISELSFPLLQLEKDWKHLTNWDWLKNGKITDLEHGLIFEWTNMSHSRIYPFDDVVMILLLPTSFVNNQFWLRPTLTNLKRLKTICNTQSVVFDSLSDDIS